MEVLHNGCALMGEYFGQQQMASLQHNITIAIYKLQVIFLFVTLLRITELWLKWPIV